jgi:hypothetical protein
MHINEERLNKNGCSMRIVEYIDNRNIVVEFQDEYKARVKTSYGNFKRGIVRNSYYPTVCGVGISGNKYPIVKNKRPTREYNAWLRMLNRCFDETVKKSQPTYKDVSMCDEWLLFDNFYEWLHRQQNFDKWYNNKRWAIDKDILVKRNKIYSPETCCLVPQNVNCLFLKREAERGQYPIGVHYTKDGFVARCRNPFTDKNEELGYYSMPEKAFYLGYKPYKEDIIKMVAKIEFAAGNITRECYDAMMNYEVEIDD